MYIWKKWKQLESSAFWDLKKPEFDQNERKKFAKILLHMVQQVWSNQKYKEGFFINKIKTFTFICMYASL